MSRIRFVVSVLVDDAAVEREGQRHGFPLETARRAIVSDLENRITDAIRFRDAVDRVGVELAEAECRERR
jgi:hypothetical protein